VTTSDVGAVGTVLLDCSEVMYCEIAQTDPRHRIGLATSVVEPVQHRRSEQRPKVPAYSIPVAGPMLIPELEDGVEEVLAIDNDLLQGDLKDNHHRDAASVQRVSRSTFEITAGVSKRGLR
jgi:hypothetical protein